jgi:DNA-binding transcriptional LysR family regulator
MIAVAAAHGLGVALMPRMLIEPELARGELAVACDRPLRAERSYFLVTPASADERPALAAFREWLVAQASGETPRA